MYRSAAAIGLLATLPACGVPGPGPDAVVLERSDLAAALGHDANLVGVALDGNRVYLLDAWEGLYEWADGELDLVANPDTLRRAGGSDLRPYTDVANLGPDLFTVTVRNDGLRLDLHAQVTEQHFCYLPQSTGPTVEQQTDAVAYDRVHGHIYAQPQSFEDGRLTDAQIGVYDSELGGQSVSWWTLNSKRFAAGGMVYDEPNLLLGSGAQLHSYEQGSQAVQAHVDLSGLGIQSIAGLALAVDDTLYIVDGSELVVVSGWRPW